MNIWKTKNNSIIYQVLSGRNNVFLIETATEFILFDSALVNKKQKLIKIINTYISSKKKLTSIILSHSHFDHGANAAAIKKIFDAQIIIHKEEAPYLLCGDSPLPKGTVFLTSFLIKIFGSIVQRMATYEGAEADIIIQGDESLLMDNSQIKIIHTPGHSIGSLSIIIDNEIAIVGDALFGIFPWSVFPPFGDDKIGIIKSWKILLNTDCSLFLPAHGRPVKRSLLGKQYEVYTRKTYSSKMH